MGFLHTWRWQWSFQCSPLALWLLKHSPLCIFSSSLLYGSFIFLEYNQLNFTFPFPCLTPRGETEELLKTPFFSSNHKGSRAEGKIEVNFHVQRRACFSSTSNAPMSDRLSLVQRWECERCHSLHWGQSSNLRTHHCCSVKSPHHLQSPDLHLCMPGSSHLDQLPELLELCFTGCSSLFSTADRFDFFKNKRKVGGKQRKGTL